MCLDAFSKKQLSFYAAVLGQSASSTQSFFISFSSWEGLLLFSLQKALETSGQNKRDFFGWTDSIYFVYLTVCRSMYGNKFHNNMP